MFVKEVEEINCFYVLHIFLFFDLVSKDILKAGAVVFFVGNKQADSVHYSDGFGN